MPMPDSSLPADPGVGVHGSEQSTASALDNLKGQAAEAAGNAKSTLNTMASEARDKIGDIVDQQKSRGADQLSGLAKAAQTAADDLAEKNPQVARLVRDAASSADHFAGELRDSDMRDVLDSVTSFARQQPVAFFAGSVLIGFALARFLKSEASAPPQSSRSPAAKRAAADRGAPRRRSASA